MSTAFRRDVLKIDCEREVNHICERIRSLLSVELKRRGLVLGVSGGIDSSVTLALAVRAVGKEKVLVLQMPERHSAEETLYLSGLVADHFGAEKIHEDISGILDAVGFYRRYADAVRTVIPEYTECWKSKIVLPNILESKSYSLFFDNSSIS